MFQITATTTVTFKCTPAVPILNMCEYVKMFFKMVMCLICFWLTALTKYHFNFSGGGKKGGLGNKLPNLDKLTNLKGGGTGGLLGGKKK